MKESTAILKERLNANLTDYQGIPFWSWNNDLDEEKLVQQIEDMKSVGLGGFIMHARIGLSMEYLGEKWFSCVEACLKKAKELGMNLIDAGHFATENPVVPVLAEKLAAAFPEITVICAKTHGDCMKFY